MPDKASSLLIRGVRVVDPVEESIGSEMDVLVVGGRIQSVERCSANDRQFAAETRIDGDGLYLAPGLIDMHVHSTKDPAASMFDRQLSTFDIPLVCSQNLASALKVGVTSVRDLGAPLDSAFSVRAAVRSGRIDGARPFVAGRMITAHGGHGSEVSLGLGLEVTGVGDARRAVRVLIGQGADVVKLVVNGAVPRTRLGQDELDAAVAEAHHAGVPVAVHAHFDSGSVRAAVLSGGDTLEHGTALTEELVVSMAATGQALCPTLSVLRRAMDSPGDFGGADNPLSRRVGDAWDGHLENVSAAFHAGVSILAGTDAGLPGVGFDSVVDELELLASRCQLGQAAALRSATSGAALALCRESELGRVKAGYFADVVLLIDNPLDDLSAYRRNLGVVHETNRMSCIHYGPR